MKLLLVRHGDYVKDAESALNEQGIADTQKVAQFLKESGVQVDSFYHSTKKRAQQTARIMRDALNPRAELCEKKYLSPNDATDRIVCDILGFSRNTMIVGHLPFLSKLASRLVTGDEHEPLVAMQPGSVIILENDSDQGWQIISFLAPALL